MCRFMIPVFSPIHIVEFGSGRCVIHHKTNGEKNGAQREWNLCFEERDLHITTLFKLNQPDQNQWRCGHKKIMEKYANERATTAGDALRNGPDERN